MAELASYGLGLNGAIDTASLFDNLVVACTTSSDAPDWYWGDGGPAATRALSHMQSCSELGCPAFSFDMRGQDGTSCRSNLDGVFHSQSWRPAPSALGAGPDWNRIEKGLDRFTPTVQAISGGILLSFEAPKAERACYAQATGDVVVSGGAVVPDILRMGDWVASSVGPGIRQIALTGFSPGSVVHWTAVCGMHRVWAGAFELIDASALSRKDGTHRRLSNRISDHQNTIHWFSRRPRLLVRVLPSRS